mmetsp:Transcript_36513/g.100760  ORF Transcript_36513/g.100760 Transcript_36513/m.100760 type:complete len:203 (-) Transcript_36513:126-734(-)
MLSQISFGIGISPDASRSVAVSADFSPGMRMFGPDALTACSTEAALASKSSTSMAGSMAMSVCPQFFAAFFDSHWPSTAPPDSTPASISTHRERPAPLWPPNVAIAPPSSASAGSDVKPEPSALYATPSGSGSPLALAVSTPKSAIADVAMSNVSGGPPLCGMPNAIGLVPKHALPPAAAATNSGELARAMPIMPFFAIRSA